MGVLFYHRKEVGCLNTSTRRITEGAMMVALVGLMLFVNRQFGNLLEYAFYWVLSFPILIYAARYGFKASIVPAVSMLLLSLMLAAPTTIFYLSSCIVIGVVYGAGVKKKWKNGTLLCWMIIFTFVSYLVSTIVLAALFGYDPQEDLEMIVTLMKYLNINTGFDMGSMLIVVTVLVAALMALMQSICIHIISNTLLDRLNIPCHPMKGLLEITLPRWVGVIIIIIWILFLCGNVVELNKEVLSTLIGLFSIAKCVAIAYGMVVLIAIVSYMHKKILVMLIIVGAFAPYIQGAIAVAGVVEMLLRIRVRLQNS